VEFSFYYVFEILPFTCSKPIRLFLAFTNSEDELQYLINHIDLIANNFNMEISSEKTKTVTF
jgi:hypothetical protein